MARPSTCLALFGFTLLGCFVATPGGDEIGETVGTETTATESSESADTSDATDTDTDTSDATDTTETTDETTGGNECEGRGGGIGNDLIMDGLFPQPDPLASCCDIFLQDCGDGQKCVPYGEAGGTWAGTKCVDVQGDGIAGDPCTFGGILGANDDCGADSYCFEVHQVGLMTIGVCTPLCGGTPLNPTCDPGTECMLANNDALALCIVQCDPLLQDCGENLACYYAHESFGCLLTTQDVPLAEPCEASNQCVAGALCAPGELLPACAGGFCCAAYCDLADPICPVMGTTCQPFYEEGTAPPGLETVGICLAPP